MRRRRDGTMEERFLRTGAVEPSARRPLPPALATTLAGLGRFAAIVALAAGLSIGVALLIGWYRGSDLWHAAAIGLYIGGAILISVPLLSAGGRSYGGGDYAYYEVEADPAGRRAWQGTLAVYLAVGLSLIGLGVLLETLA